MFPNEAMPQQAVPQIDATLHANPQAVGRRGKGGCVLSRARAYDVESRVFCIWEWVFARQPADPRERKWAGSLLAAVT